MLDPSGDADPAAVEASLIQSSADGADDRRQPWRLLAGSETIQVDLPLSTSARDRLHREIRELGPGARVAVCCTAFGSRWRCRSFMRSAGLELTREYLAIPSASAPTIYVESTPQAFLYFFTRLLSLPRGRATSAAVLGVAKAVSGIVPLNGLFSVLAPTRIAMGRVAVRPGVPTQSAPMGGLLDVFGMHAVVVALSKDPNAKVTVLLMPEGAVEPALAVKVATTELARASVDAERHVLTVLHEYLPATVRATIPAIKAAPALGDCLDLVTEALPGTPMTARYHRWRHLATPSTVRADFQAAQRWLALFQGATATGRAPMDVFGASMRIVIQRFSDDPQLQEVVSRLDALNGRLRRSETPRTAVHGDFWFGNLMMVGDAVSGVVDWEFGNVQGEPVRDLIRFALTYALYLDRHTKSGRRVAGHPGLTAGEWGAGIEFAMDGEGWFPRLFRDFIQDGLERLGADPDCWRDAALVGLAEIAASADHLDFARLHWQLFARLANRDPAVSP